MLHKKIPIVCLAALLAISNAGGGEEIFPIARDITNVQMMRTLALDQGEDARFLVTVSGGVRAGDEGSDPQPPVILSWEGETVFAACLRIQTYGDGYVSLGHVGQCVVSAEVAQGGTESLLDFVERDDELRIDTDLYVTEEEPAAAVLTEVASSSKAATDRLDSIRRDLGTESLGWPVTVREFLTDLEDNGCGMAPVVELEQEEEEMTIRCDRMCWFREGKLAGTLTQEQSRAAAILLGQAESGAVECTLSDGSLAGLRLTGADCGWEPVWEGDELTELRLTVTVRADLAELQGGASPNDPAVRRELNEGLSAVLREQIASLIAYTREENADLLHLRRTIETACPARYRRIEENWERWFSAVPIAVRVNGVVERSYDIDRAERLA